MPSVDSAEGRRHERGLPRPVAIPVPEKQLHDHRAADGAAKEKLMSMGVEAFFTGFTRFWSTGNTRDLYFSNDSSWRFANQTFC